MTLAGFKFIFFWEWVHRLFGRIIGIVFAVASAMVRGQAGDPQRLWLAARRPVRARRPAGRDRLVHGDVRLEGRTEVSPYRLSAHLLMALFLIAALIWTALDLRGCAMPTARAADRLGRLALAVLFVQLMLGAWVADFARATSPTPGPA